MSTVRIYVFEPLKVPLFGGEHRGIFMSAENLRGNWNKHYNHSPEVELVFAPNTGVELACCPKTGVALVLAPKAGGWEGVAVKGDPKDEPNEGV